MYIIIARTTLHYTTHATAERFTTATFFSPAITQGPQLSHSLITAIHESDPHRSSLRRRGEMIMAAQSKKDQSFRAPADRKMMAP